MGRSPAASVATTVKLSSDCSSTARLPMVQMTGAWLMLISNDCVASLPALSETTTTTDCSSPWVVCGVHVMTPVWPSITIPAGEVVSR